MRAQWTTRWRDPRIRALAVVAAAGAIASACGGGTDTPAPTDMAVLPPDLVLADLRAPGYPAGPYGGELDSVLPNLTFQGYWSPTKTMGLASAEPFGEVNFDMIRTSGAKVAILNMAAFW